MSKQGFVYIITNQYGTILYIGVTSDLIKRIYEHKNKLVEGFSEKYNLNKLVYFEQFDNIIDAIEREKYLKGKKRTFKNELINSLNAKWIDLYPQITGCHVEQSETSQDVLSRCDVLSLCGSSVSPQNDSVVLLNDNAVILNNNTVMLSDSETSQELEGLDDE